MAPRILRLTLTYRGSSFSGWQRQSRQPSVQQAVEEALAKLTGAAVTVHGCGRTDAGVHALAYVAHCTTETTLACAAIRRALNTHLPESIRILRVADAPAGFHARYGARAKTYRYVVAGVRSPLLEGQALFKPFPLDLPAMKKAAGQLKGRHDFKAFQAAGSAIRETVRTVQAISFRRETYTLDPAVPLLIIEITADGFLYRMARNIVGALLEVGRGRLTPDRVKEILDSRDRRKGPPTAPAHGLYLRRATYTKASNRHE